MRFLSVQPRNRTVPVYYITKTKNIQAGEEDFLKAGCKYDALAVPGLQKIPLAGEFSIQEQLRLYITFPILSNRHETRLREGNP